MSIHYVMYDNIGGGIIVSNLLIFGAGGHGKVVLEAAELEGKWNQIAFLDDRQDLKCVFNYNIIGNISKYTQLIDRFEYAFVAMGNNQLRLQWIDRLLDANYKVPTIIHPKASVSKYSNLEVGTVILAGAVVNISTKIGRGSIININACVDHDCEIGNGVHISAGAIVRSSCKVGDLSNLKATSCVKEGTCLGKNFLLPEGRIADGDQII